MSYEMENLQLDSEIRMLEMQIATLKNEKGDGNKELMLYEARLRLLIERRKKSKITRMLGDAEMHHVSGRVWSINDGCFLWMLIFWGICFLISLPFLLSH